MGDDQFSLKLIRRVSIPGREILILKRIKDGRIGICRSRCVVKIKEVLALIKVKVSPQVDVATYKIIPVPSFCQSISLPFHCDLKVFLQITQFSSPFFDGSHDLLDVHGLFGGRLGVVPYYILVDSPL